MARALGRGGAEDRYERMDKSFHERLRQGFLAIADANPQRCEVVSALGDIGNVHRGICDAVTRRLGTVLPSIAEP